MIGVLIFAAAVLGQGAGPAATPAAPAAAEAATPDAAKPAAKPVNDPLICRTEAPLGSRLGKRTCLPKSVRDEQERRAKETTQNIQRGGLGPWLEK